jgi:glutathione S-transferase
MQKKRRFRGKVAIISLFIGQGQSMVLPSSSPTTMDKSVAKFVTNKMCPYAQKAWIALEASDTKYSIYEVSLYGKGGKPTWFMKLNPAGTVPVLVCDDGDNVYPDSELILDYIKDNTGLHSPDKDIDEVKVKVWRDNLSQKIIPIGKEAVLGGSTDRLFDLLEYLDDQVQGPFLCGKTVTVADCAVFPFVWRINHEFGLVDGSKLKRWLELCMDTSCFKKTIQRSWWWWW